MADKEHFIVRLNYGEGRMVATGLSTPIAGLAITDGDLIGSEHREGYDTVLMHVPTGLAIGWFLSAESAAGCALAIADWADWTQVDPDERDRPLGGRTIDAVREWGGRVFRTGLGVREAV